MAYLIEEVDLLLDELNERTEKSLAAYNSELGSMRVGRANVRILDGIIVDFYGTATPINQVANITIPEARMLAVSVWDASMTKKVEKAIIDANIGITPNNDGKTIRLIFPEPTEERRRALVKDLKNSAEKTKVAIRNIRRDTIEELKKFKKDSIVTEDEQENIEKDIDKVVSQQIAEVDRMASAKEAEILKV